MHAYLVIGKDQKARLKRAQTLLEKTRVLEKIQLGPPESHHTIEDIRALRRGLALKSREDAPRGVLLQEVQKLTTEAANAFLKTLEEPPQNTLIILTAPNAQVVLPTIVSRCLIQDLGPQVLEVAEEEKEAALKLWQKLTHGGVGERLKFVETISAKEEGLAFVVGQILAARKMLLQKPSLEATKILENLEKTRQDLEANVSPKLTIADLLLHYPQIS